MFDVAIPRYGADSGVKLSANTLQKSQINVALMNFLQATEKASEKKTRKMKVKASLTLHNRAQKTQSLRIRVVLFG